jgi:hypothetical protein
MEITLIISIISLIFSFVLTYYRHRDFNVINMIEFKKEDNTTKYRINSTKNEVIINKIIMFKGNGKYKYEFKYPPQIVNCIINTNQIHVNVWNYINNGFMDLINDEDNKTNYNCKWVKIKLDTSIGYKTFHCKNPWYITPIKYTVIIYRLKNKYMYSKFLNIKKYMRVFNSFKDLNSIHDIDKICNSYKEIKDSKRRWKGKRKFIIINIIDGGYELGIDDKPDEFGLHSYKFIGDNFNE